MGFFCCFNSKPPQSSTSTHKHTQVTEPTEINNDTKTVKLFTYKELKVATRDFRPECKIGEGGFGSVYKGRLRDGRIAAIKVLAEDSTQGVKEFLTELSVISNLDHENLVKLYGCCLEGKNRILLFNYLENDCLQKTLLDPGYNNNIDFTWEIRRNICLGIARGLAYLHEEITPCIIHRDIKASNILLDADLNPKISDFGFAKLLPANKSHVSTRVAGTIGYLAPEYASRGQLTKKSDVYSFGILLMEIVSGRCNTNNKLPPGLRLLLERAWELYERDSLMEIVDSSLENDPEHVNQACKFLKIGLICTQNSIKNRPSMTTVVKMLMGKRDVDMLKISRPSILWDLEGETPNSYLSNNNTMFSTPNTSH